MWPNPGYASTTQAHISGLVKNKSGWNPWCLCMPCLDPSIRLAITVATCCSCWGPNASHVKKWNWEQRAGWRSVDIWFSWIWSLYYRTNSVEPSKGRGGQSTIQQYQLRPTQIPLSVGPCLLPCPPRAEGNRGLKLFGNSSQSPPLILEGKGTTRFRGWRPLDKCPCSSPYTLLPSSLHIQKRKRKKNLHLLLPRALSSLLCSPSYKALKVHAWSLCSSLFQLFPLGGLTSWAKPTLLRWQWQSWPRPLARNLLYALLSSLTCPRASISAATSPFISSIEPEMRGSLALWSGPCSASCFMSCLFEFWQWVYPFFFPEFCGTFLIFSSQAPAVAVKPEDPKSKGSDCYGVFCLTYDLKAVCSL